MKDFVRGCLFGAFLIAAAFLLAGVVLLLKHLPPWLSLTGIGIALILGMGEIFRRTGGP
jgi:hypothetical protein